MKRRTYECMEQEFHSDTQHNDAELVCKVINLLVIELLLTNLLQKK
jgi:hypothetical protein